MFSNCGMENKSNQRKVMNKTKLKENNCARDFKSERMRRNKCSRLWKTFSAFLFFFVCLSRTCISLLFAFVFGLIQIIVDI